MDVLGLFSLEITGYVAIALFGMAVGIIGSMIGLGGGTIIVPVLSAFGLPPTVVASSSISAVLSNAIASTSSYARQRRIAYKTGILLGALSVPGAILGSFATELTAPEEFHMAFAVILAGSGAYVILKPRLSRGTSRKPGQRSMMLAGAISFAVGIMYEVTSYIRRPTSFDTLLPWFRHVCTHEMNADRDRAARIPPLICPLILRNTT